MPAPDLPPAPNPGRCPLCGAPNQCAMEAGATGSPCWCTTVRFDAALLDRIPAPARGKACLCPACVGFDAADAQTAARRDAATG
ncbi:MAG: cysteine-rich CWC family protein [Proteobacteria bacterium]|nr:cysteine-rich CWC family protein [Pseudomonadota bacterium]